MKLFECLKRFFKKSEPEVEQPPAETGQLSVAPPPPRHVIIETDVFDMDLLFDCFMQIEKLDVPVERVRVSPVIFDMISKHHSWALSHDPIPSDYFPSIWGAELVVERGWDVAVMVEGKRMQASCLAVPEYAGWYQVCTLDDKVRLRIVEFDEDAPIV